MVKKEKPRGRPFEKGHPFHQHHFIIENPTSTDSEEPNSKKKGKGRPRKELPVLEASTSEASAASLLGELPVPHADHTTRGIITRLMSKKYLSEQEIIDKKDEYFICHKESMEALCNRGFKGHFKSNPKCEGELKLKKTLQFGVSTGWCWYCETCPYECKQEKLWVSVERAGPGVRASSLNRSLGAGMAWAGVGPTGTREILAHCGINPGSRSCMQENHNLACDIIAETGDDVLAFQRQSVKGHPLAVATDCQYPTRQGKDTPFQSSNQAVSSTIDTVTGMVLTVITANKLCKRASTRMIEGEMPDCPNHADGSKCTANTKITQAIGDEPERFRETARIFRKDGLEVKFVTSDGDTKLGPIIQEEFGSEVEHFRDIRHFSSTIKNGIIKSVFSDKMFKCKLKKNVPHLQRRFAEDVRKRISFMFKHAVKMTKDLPDEERKSEMLNRLNGKSNVIVKCMNNDHSECDEFLCEQWKKVRRIKTSRYKMKQSDKKILKAVIDRWLCKNGILQTWRNEDTQKCEALHRMYLKSCPKHLTFVRNYRARILRAALVKNLGFEGSTTLILHRVGHSISGNVKKKFSEFDKTRAYGSKYQSTSKAKKRRIQRREANWKIHKMHGEEGNKYGNNVE